MKRSFYVKCFYRVCIPGASLFILSGCGLSDAQLTSIWQSVIQTALTTAVTQWLSSLTTTAAIILG